MTNNSQGSSDDSLTIREYLHKTTVFLEFIAAIGAAALLVWASTRPGWEKVTAFGTGTLLAGSTALVGGVLGLLFGIPKSISDPPATTAPKSDPVVKGNSNSVADQDQDDASRASYSVNTNLEQISDWLTKIIVGVSLTQIGTIRDQFLLVAHFFANGFNGGVENKSDVVAAALIIAYGLTTGFLAGYLLTRMFLPGAFNQADATLRKKFKALGNRYAELAVQSDEDRKAIAEAGRVQGMVYSDLYRYEERGFADAIQKISDLFQAPINRKNAALWTYLAASHGQAYQWETEHENNSDVLKRHRDEALKAVTEAIELGEAWKPILQLMWDKNHPVKSKHEWAKAEDDLEMFYDDERFKILLG